MSLNFLSSIRPSETLPGSESGWPVREAETPETRGSSFQENSGFFEGYHFAESECVGEMISIEGANPPDVLGAGAIGACGSDGAGAKGAAPPIVYDAFPKFESTSVPFPSAASTEPAEKATEAVPALSARRVTFAIVPLCPVNGVGVPPLKVIVPASFEYDGSVVHRLNTEPSFETPETERSDVSNDTVPSAAFTPAPPVSSTSRATNVFPAA